MPLCTYLKYSSDSVMGAQPENLSQSFTVATASVSAELKQCKDELDGHKILWPYHISFYNIGTYESYWVASCSWSKSKIWQIGTLGQITDIVVGGSFYNDQALRVTCAVHMAVSIMKSFRQLELDNYIEISFVSGQAWSIFIAEGPYSSFLRDNNSDNCLI